MNVVDITKDKGVIKEIIKEGKGNNLNEKDSVFLIHYTGKNKDGNIFETTKNEAPVEFDIGKDEIIKGLELSIPTMKIGEISKILILPEYHHGKNGSLNKKIKKNEIIEYEIEILKCEKKKKNFWELEFDERLRIAELKKEEGKSYFLDKIYDKSKRRYLKSIKYLQNKENLKEKEIKKFNEISNLCYLNIAACELKLENYENVIHYCDLSLEIEKKNNIKGLFRRAQAYSNLSEFEKSKQDFNQILKFDNIEKKIENQVKNELKILEKNESKYQNQMKKMFSGVFNEK
eukprot:gene7729-12199_t